MDVDLSDHAKTRMAQRNFSIDDVMFVLRYGRSYHRAGVVFYQMQDRQMPRDLAGNDRRRRLGGVTILVARDRGSVITIQWDQKGFRSNNKKARYDRRRGGRYQAH